MTVPTALARPIIRLNLRNVWRWVAFGTLIGGVAAFGAMVFNLLCQFSLQFFLGTLVGWQPDEAAGEAVLSSAAATVFRPWMLPLVVALISRHDLISAYNRVRIERMTGQRLSS